MNSDSAEPSGKTEGRQDTQQTAANDLTQPIGFSTRADKDARLFPKLLTWAPDGTVHNEMEYAYALSCAMIEDRHPSGRIVKNTPDFDGALWNMAAGRVSGVVNLAVGFNPR